MFNLTTNKINVNLTSIKILFFTFHISKIKGKITILNVNERIKEWNISFTLGKH